jgi:hypothetical protein
MTGTCVAEAGSLRSELNRKPAESASAWLGRLRRIDPGRLPEHTRKALTLSISYAQHVIRKERG